MPKASTNRQKTQSRRFAPWDALRRYGRLLTDSKQSRLRRALYAGAGVFGLFALACVMLLLYALVLYPFTPSTRSLKSAKVEQPTVVLAADGGEVTQFRRVNREWVPLDAISDDVLAALIATEDHRFYDHGGIDLRRVFSAMFFTASGDVQGASTITMQLARNLYPDRIGRALSVTRKLKEMITALKIEAVYDKDEILETYLNTVPFLYNAFGIEMAARTYFGKSAADLTLLEGATLVGMLKGTTFYNPARNPDRAKQRRNVVLRQMVAFGELPEAEYEKLKDEPLGLDFEPQPFQKSKAPHFTKLVRQLVSDWADRHGYNLYTDGLVVHTTLDLRLQEAAQAAVTRQLDALQDVADVEWGQSSFRLISTSAGAYRSQRQRVQPFQHFWDRNPDLVAEFIRDTPRYRSGRSAGLDEAALLDSLRSDRAFMDSLRTAKTRLESGFAAIDPQSGHVRAWVGSRDFFKDEYDHVQHARRQPGSTFKPFVYAAALEEGFRPDDTFPDREVSIPLGGGRVWRPTNAEGASGRDLTLREGLAHSKNTITAQLIAEVGADDVADLARDMGINRSPLDEVPSLALGTSAVTLLEMVAAYSTIANGGTYREPVWITRIEDKDGNVLATFDEQDVHEALDEDVAWTLLDMMRGVVDEGTGRRIRNTFGIRADVAGKTGTTQDNADGWFILMHPNLVGGAWVGFNDQRITFRSDYWGQGAHNALYVVGDVYRQGLRAGFLNANATFPAAPVLDRRRRESLTDRLGRWLGGVLDEIGGAFEGEGDAREQRDPPRVENPRPAPPPPASVEEGRQQQRVEAERTQRRLEQMEREREKQRREIQKEERRQQQRAEREQRKAERERRKQNEKGDRIGW